MSLIIPVLLTFHVAVCLLLVLAVLMQLPRSEGLGAAFGGSVTENIFGAQTTNVLAKFTVWLGIAFFALTLFLAMAYARQGSAKGSSIQKELLGAPVPAAVDEATPAAAASPVAPVTEPVATPAVESVVPEVAPESVPEASTPATESSAVTEPVATPSPEQVP